MTRLSKHTHGCPLCKGTGKVSKHVANSQVSLRDRVKYNETMRAVNKKARLRKKRKKRVAT